ncbi:FG-GAP and VCBS repeat-containing protein [Tenggerimyces flavus]|uniref:FG-GAP and VCBS repeat-containing protein n=1 Tax=Tenggerimyces flavus TaxID=1708749 RepID=A0ABV7YJB6_9ACTN|nr:FG-GAP and VCBS repeat-containing protein [Tenggerimyces flavus]MBM7787490.1 hypothetical protein [Tenggerimyces flavus]
MGSTSSQAAVQPAKPSDYNGDGYPDLAIGAMFARPKPFTLRRDAGGVGLVYGSKSVLGTKTQLLHRGASWVPGPQSVNQWFGKAVTAGDFNGDGYSDIAICSDAGYLEDRVTLGFGGSNGLWRGLDLYVPDLTRLECNSLAAGDFNGDSYADLAIVGRWVAVLYGKAWINEASYDDLERLGPYLWRGAPAVGDVNGDGMDDLVTGAGANAEGWDRSIRLYKGRTEGLRAEADQVLPPGVYGDVDDDGYADLAAAQPGATRAGKAGAGLVTLWWGAASGIDTSRSKAVLAQDVPGVPGDVGAGDGFGASVDLGDTDGDGHADLAVAAGENVSNQVDAGTVTVVRGSKTGWDLSKPAPYLSQGSPGVPEEAETNDYFGRNLLLRDFDSDGRAELVVAAPYDDVGSKPFVRSDVGTVTVFRGTAAGVSTTGAKLITPTTVRMMSLEARWGELDG